MPECSLGSVLCLSFFLSFNQTEVEMFCGLQSHTELYDGLWLILECSSEMEVVCNLQSVINLVISKVNRSFVSKSDLLFTGCKD